MTYLGRVHKGAIVLDTPVKLEEGTPVRVETLEAAGGGEEQVQRAERYRLLLELLRKWDEEDSADDGRLADLLQQELAADHGIRFRDDRQLNEILTQP